MGSLNILKPLSTFLQPLLLINLSNIDNFFPWNFFGNDGNKTGAALSRSNNANLTFVLCCPWNLTSHLIDTGQHWHFHALCIGTYVTSFILSRCLHFSPSLHFASHRHLYFFTLPIDLFWSVSSFPTLGGEDIFAICCCFHSYYFWRQLVTYIHSPLAHI